MIEAVRDPSLDALLDLHGQTFVVDPDGRYWVRFVVYEVPPTREKPHGLDYALTLHDETNQRIVGFDNAHAVRTGSGPGHGGPTAFDHRHRHMTVRPYEYQDAATLLADFWNEVDRVLREKGVI